MAHAVLDPDASLARLARFASGSSRRVWLLAAAVVAAFTTYCIGYTLITGGTIDPLLSITWAAAAVVPWAACWPILRRAARRARAEGALPLASVAGPLGLAAVAAAALERCSALAFGVQHGATFTELVLRRLPVMVGFVLAARLYVRLLASREAHERPALAEAERARHPACALAEPELRAAPMAAEPELHAAPTPAVQALHRSACAVAERELRGPTPTVVEQALEIATRSGAIELRPCDIDWVKAAGNYLELYAGGRCHLVRRTLKGFAATAGAEQFLRIHRSVLVNRGRLAGLVRRPRGRLAIRLQDGSTLAVGRGFRADVERALG
jgi:DNA-binding LytR/AlgR family response regulator